jgi:hypothetical protein
VGRGGPSGLPRFFFFNSTPVNCTNWKCPETLYHGENVTYEVTFVVVVDADDDQDAVEQARELVSHDDFEPTKVEDITIYEGDAPSEEDA